MKRIVLLACSVLIFATVFPTLAKVAPKNTKSQAVSSTDLLERAKKAYYNYDFEEASSLFSQYERAAGASQELAEEWENKTNIAMNAFERVQEIVVIDTIIVPRGAFYRAIKLPSSAGRIGRSADLKIKGQSDINEVSYINEDSDYLITPMEDESGNLTLLEHRLLLDGTWETLDALKGDFEKDGDYAFPFLSADGQTLYFANNGEGSMGGFDLFVAQKEPITGESLQPLNLGMPFNSPYDDLMMAIDEENGIGWWASDRNQPGGDITIFIYILDDIRKNYSSDNVNLKEFAIIPDFKSTWKEGDEEKYGKILSKVK